MNLKLKTEEDILNEEFRRQVIKEITDDQENIRRKAEALRRHEIYRDKNSKWVMKAIEKEGFKEVTVEQMRNRAANVSVARKIVNKLASTYVGGVDREAAQASDQQSMDALTEELDVNRKFKKADRYRQLQKNTLMQIVPVLDTRETESDSDKKYNLLIKNLAPWEYDVIEDEFDKTKPRVVILTDFHERERAQSLSSLAGAEGRRVRENPDSTEGDGRDQIIADSPADAGRGYGMGDDDRTFIFWTDKYHVTCTADGKKVPGTGEPGDVNPIKRLPFVNITDDQDGQFWATGGDDVVEGSILINKKLTDINFIIFVQGWGQLVVAARNVPKKLVGGPDNAFIFEKEDNEGDVQVFFASSNPPIGDWLETVRTFLAMLLTTNNLSVRNVSAKLDVTNAASGVALMIEGAEVISDSKDTRKLFQDKEPEFWEVLRLWHTLYHEKNALVKVLQEIKPLKVGDCKCKFHELKPPMSESEHLDVLEKRQKIGLSTLKDLVKKDNPDLTDAEAEAKVKELMEEKKKNQETFMGGVAKKLTGEGLKPGEDPNGKQEAKPGEKPEVPGKEAPAAQNEDDEKADEDEEENGPRT